MYHAKDAQALMLVRMALGLVHLGKGTMTLNAYHSDRQLMCPVSVAALTIVSFAFLAKNCSFFLILKSLYFETVF